VILAEPESTVATPQAAIAVIAQSPSPSICGDPLRRRFPLALDRVEWMTVPSSVEAIGGHRSLQKNFADPVDSRMARST
jgi:hypothetical protein